mgnify:CR=1 FL=1
MQAILDASTPTDWRALDPAHTLYLELESGRVVIELAPAFAPAHVANIQALARGHYWDGLSIYRSHDNFVVQFGDPTEDEATRKPIGDARAHLPAEFTRDAEGLPFTALPDRDGYAPEAGFVEGFPAGRDPATGQAWLAHCYGALGAGRDVAADSSNGTELYVVTGQSPRQLDRNITVVGRVLRGMELLSTIPRGPEPMGFYENPALRTPIRCRPARHCLAQRRLARCRLARRCLVQRRPGRRRLVRSRLAREPPPSEVVLAGAAALGGTGVVEVDRAGVRRHLDRAVRQDVIEEPCRIEPRLESVFEDGNNHGVRSCVVRGRGCLPIIGLGRRGLASLTC